MKIIRSRRRSIALVVTEDAQLIVRAPLRLSLSEIERFIRQQQRWIERQQAKMRSRPSRPTLSEAERSVLWREALTRLSARTAYWAELTGLRPARVRISRAKQRWGSCGPKGTVNLCWRLVRAPQEVIDYVIVHELAHLAERNHSSRFWERVAAIIPGHRVHRRWLRENSHLLPA